MPAGQNGLGTAQTPAGGTVAGGPGTWLPPFRLGQGLTGVFADPLGLIAGEPATATTANIGGTVNAQSSTGSGSDSGNNASGAPSGGTASSMDSGGNTSSGPAPKATSQAQRDANNAAASAAYPGYKGAG